MIIFINKNVLFNKRNLRILEIGDKYVIIKSESWTKKRNC